MEASELNGDVVLTGDQIGAFVDLIERTHKDQAFDLARLRTAIRIARRPSLHESEWRVTLEGQRGTVVIPIQGLA